MPKISVLMPVYNTNGEYLKEAIESILNQTYQDFEFLILDDGSTNEDTINILNNYIQKDGRIRIIKGKHKGIGSAINQLIEKATGEFIARMDSDDISVPSRFEKQIAYFEKHPDISILSSSYKTYPEGKPIIHPENITYLKLLKGCFITHPAVMIRKKDLDKYQLRYNENLKVSEDYELWSRAIRYLKFANIKEPLLKYRVLKNSNFHKNTEEVIQTDNQIRQNMLDFLTDDKELQDNIKNLIFVKKSQKLTYRTLEHIFSVKNFCKNGQKRKVFKVLGIKFKFKIREKINVVKLMGGLGNQMFQYAFGKALENKTGRKVLYDISWFEEIKKHTDKNGVAQRKYELEIFSPNIKFASKKQIANCKKKITEKKEFIFDKNLLKDQKSAYYEGYFQNEKYFENIKDNLKKEFSFPQISPYDKFNSYWLNRINECENPVFIHFRRGDYLNLSGWILSLDYYKKAIQYIQNNVNNPTFFIFGQDCENYIKTEFNINTPYELVGEINSQNLEDWKDIVLMQSCKHGIIANSTFSWWAAWLGKASEGIVTAPSPFINGQDEIICKNWIKISSSL